VYRADAGERKQTLTDGLDAEKIRRQRKADAIKEETVQGYFLSAG